jgi:hypothetical protein
MLGLYKFFWDCGRNGELHGLFIASEKEVSELIGKQVYFGEVLGKHSDISGDIEPGEITLISSDPDYIAITKKLFGITMGNTLMGYNPLDFIGPE